MSWSQSRPGPTCDSLLHLPLALLCTGLHSVKNASADMGYAVKNGRGEF